MITFEPSDSICPTTLVLSPFTTAPMAITVLTPMTMPSTVRNERSGLRRRASNARATASRNSCKRAVVWLAIWRGIRSLLRPECHDRIKARGFRRGVNPKEQADADRHQQAGYDRPGLHGIGQRGRPGNDFGEQNPQQHSPESPDRGDAGRFDQELQANVALPRAQRLAQ